MPRDLGTNVVPVLTSDPSNTGGDTWYRSDNFQFKGRGGSHTSILTSGEWPFPISGVWYPIPQAPLAGTTTATMVLNTSYAIPFWTACKVTLSSVAINITTAGLTSNVVRFGLYDSTTGGLPNSVQAQTTVASTSIAVIQASLSNVLDPGLWWFTLVSQVGTACKATFATSMNPLVGDFATTPNFGAGAMVNGYSNSGVSGTFGSPYATLTASTQVPLIQVKFA